MKSLNLNVIIFLAILSFFIPVWLYGVTATQQLWTFGTAGSNPASGKMSMFSDSTTLNLRCKNSSGTFFTCVDLSPGVSTGSSPPTVVPGTGGVDGYAEGSGPSTCAASAVDCLWGDSTLHGLMTNFNNDGNLPLTRGPASATIGNCPSFATTTGGKFQDSGVACGSAFVDFVSGSSTVTNTGTPVNVYSYSAPALPAGACFAMKFQLTYSNAINITVTVAVGSTVVATPWSTTSGLDNTIWSLQYCNQSGVQNAQYLIYDRPMFYSNANGAPQAVYYQGGSSPFSPSNSDNVFSTPTAVDWSTGKTITIRTTAASGNTVGAYAIIWQH